MNQNDSIIENYISSATEYEKNGEIAKALFCYTEAINLDNKLKDERLSRANLFFQIGDYKNALSDYNYLANSDKETPFLRERAVCNETLGNLNEALECYLMVLLDKIDVDAYYVIHRIVKEHSEFRTKINFRMIDDIFKMYVDETRALKFKESASEFDLDQRNDFLDLYIQLLPQDSQYLYDAYLNKAKAEILRYRLCFDTKFREKLKQKYNVTDSQLNEKYKFVQENLSELNLVYAVQRFNEATRYAKNLQEVLLVDDEVKKIMNFANYELS